MFLYYPDGSIGIDIWARVMITIVSTIVFSVAVCCEVVRHGQHTGLLLVLSTVMSCSPGHYLHVLFVYRFFFVVKGTSILYYII